MLSMPPCEGVAQLYEVFEDSKSYYIVTELDKGRDLFEELNSNKEFSVDGTRAIMKPILEAVAHFHENSALRKDLKLPPPPLLMPQIPSPLPSPLLLPSPFQTPKSVKIINFGTEEEWAPKEKDALDTDQYIAQESYHGTYSQSSDIFALGVIMYKLVTGKFPFPEEIFDDEPGQNIVGHPKMKRIQNMLKMANTIWDQACFMKNPALSDLCAHMLAYEAIDRPSARDVLNSGFFRDPA
eukprot:gnl/MRDRNA2_/MRDRNA2_25069_c0_seq1.p1 gnl/MRDRNA2_/MRDRNA2_25069_c0~~gnl/MRDRNA2_/MRDRNA2_25069_c0_seq1.p1  ORF type:complete len:239 (-),score=39.27 gnl/MRDRNA2_/MRDRNA2_25069_c0_seq1:351-1067(-)